jgi:hypothetical protein
MTDDTLLRRFEGCDLSMKEWHHREHLRLAYLYLTRLPYAGALERMRAGLKALNAAQQVPETPERGYHETLTQGWMRLMYCAICENGLAENSEAFLDTHTHLLARRAMLFFYSRERLMSAEAKAQWVEPDLAPLPRSRRGFPKR